MPDIRLVRRRGSQLWIWTGVLAVIGLIIWASALIYGDPTDPAEPRRVGAAAEFGAQRAPVLPIEPVSFDSLAPLNERDLGRLVRLTGTVESRSVRGGVWVRAADGRRILARVEPLPEGMTLPFRPGGGIDIQGYLQSISRAEFIAWMDSLGVRIPRPPPAPRFGTVPDPSFARLEALYIREYYVSIRPEQLQRNGEQQAASNGFRRSGSAPEAFHRSSHATRYFMNWSPEQMDVLERAISQGTRVELVRRGTDYSVIPRSLRPEGATEVLTATHVTTGENLEFRLDEIEEWSVLA
jgi:hypothetical protein